MAEAEVELRRKLDGESKNYSQNINIKWEFKVNVLKMYKMIYLRTSNLLFEEKGIYICLQYMIICTHVRIKNFFVHVVDKQEKKIC